MVPLVRELGGVALRDAQAALGEVELIGRLREDLQHEGLEAGHLHALGQRADERERLELHQRRAAHLLEQRDGEGGRAVGVREQLLPGSVSVSVSVSQPLCPGSPPLPLCGSTYSSAAPRLQTHTADATGISLHPAGDYIVTCSADRRWGPGPIETGQMLA